MDFQIILENLIGWLLSHGIKILLILIFAWIISKTGKIFIMRLISALAEKSFKIKGVANGKVQKKREKTLIQVFGSFFKGLVWILAILTILPELGLNIGPLLAGVGVVGLALGMGARNLIQDYLAGLFIIFEDQYRVGEEIKIIGVQGKVLDINLRRTLILNGEGVHFIPNGQIKTASNLSRG